MLTKIPVIIARYVSAVSTTPHMWMSYENAHVDLDDEEIVFHGRYRESKDSLRESLNDIKREYQYPYAIRYTPQSDQVYIIRNEIDEIEALLKFSK